MKPEIFAYAATETGNNHKKIEKVCEDASGYYDDEIMHICVVADGHGSDNYPRTDRGAEFAVNSAIKCVKEFIKAANPKEVLIDKKIKYPLLIQLAKSILRNWHQLVEDDYNNENFSTQELINVSDKYKERYLSDNPDRRKIEKAYGCTLIVFAVTSQYSFGLQIGDGKCIYINRKGEFLEPIPEDDNCQLNVTTSICDSDAIDEFRFYVTDEIPVAVFCGSDGVEDSYSSLKELQALYRSVLSVFIDYDIETGKKELKEYLPVLSRKGSGDDISIAAIINIDLARKVAEIFKVDAEIFSLREEEKTIQNEINYSFECRDRLEKTIKGYVEKILDNSIDDKILLQINQLNGKLKGSVSKLIQIRTSIGELEKRKNELVNVVSFEQHVQKESDEVDSEINTVQTGTEDSAGSITEYTVQTESEKNKSESTLAQKELEEANTENILGQPIQSKAEENVESNSERTKLEDNPVDEVKSAEVRIVDASETDVWGLKTDDSW